MGVLSRTPIAAIQFKAFSGVHKRVYYQDDVGNIRETCYDEDRGWFIPDADIVGVGRLNTGIAAVTWGNGTQIRVYFFDQSNNLVERVSEAVVPRAWTIGQLNTLDIVCAPNSKVAATALFVDEPLLGVYFQGTDSNLYVATYSSSEWILRKLDISPILMGTSICATMLGDQSRRVFAFEKEDKLIEVSSQDGEFWEISSVVSHRPDLDSGAGIAVVPSDPLNIQTVMTSRYAFFIYQEDISDWLPLPSLLGDAMERSDMASVFIDGNIYSFYQQSEKQIIEFKQDTSNVDVVTEVPVRQ